MKNKMIKGTKNKDQNLKDRHEYMDSGHISSNQIRKNIQKNKFEKTHKTKHTL